MLLEVLVGFCVGVLARYAIPDSAGVGADTLLGIVGSGVGAFTYKLFGHRPAFDEWNAWSLVCAAAGAFVLIVVVRAASARRTIA